MASAAAALKEKGYDSHRLGPERLSADVHVPGRARDRGDERLRRAEPGAQARPRRDRQRHLARQPGGGMRARPQAAVSARCRSCCKEFFIRGKRSPGGQPARTARPPPPRC
ncbi:MAG: hypothetical protein MZW92_39995 [Comamonadaceae bacterium]|nr:hypothetical protein [Comamonadaceae bacterium]